jgi:hypothetical protein
MPPPSLAAPPEIVILRSVRSPEPAMWKILKLGAAAARESVAPLPSIVIALAISGRPLAPSTLLLGWTACRCSRPPA